MFRCLILIYSFLNVGDVSHVDALHAKLLEQNTKVIRINLDANLSDDALADAYKKALDSIEASESVTMAIGEKGVVALENLNKRNLLKSGSYIAASVHQPVSDLKSLPLEFLAVPEATLNPTFKQEVLKTIPYQVLTVGVPTLNPDIQTLEKQYTNWQLANKPTLDKPYIIVMLPGDAPDIDGKMKYFTAESAKDLFQNIVLLRKKLGDKHIIIVENGPRTGKHDPLTGKVIASHEFSKEDKQSLAVDQISSYFLKLMEESNIPYSFFNFTFEVNGKEKKAISVNNQLIYIAKMGADNYFIVPGESVSMMAQVPHYLKPNQVIIFEPSSMNEQHKAVFHSLQDKGHVSYFSTKSEVIHQPTNPTQMLAEDSTLVARGLIDGFNKRASQKKVACENFLSHVLQVTICGVGEGNLFCDNSADACPA